MDKQKLTKIRSAVATLASLSDEDWEELFGMIEDPCWVPKISKRNKIKTGENLQENVSLVLKKLGVPANIKGYRYLSRAIVLYMIAEKPLGVTKELYPTIAVEFNDTPSKVERAIRHAIEKVYKYANGNEALGYLFGDATKFKTGRPSNTEFIAAIAEYLKVN